MARAAFAVLASIGLIASAPGAQARQASSQGRSSAQIIEPLRASPIADLSFGTLTVGAANGGEVSVPAAGSRASYSGSAAPACGAASQCQPHPARFAVSGEANRAYQVHLPARVQARGMNTGQLLDISRLSVRSDNAAATGERGLLDRNGRDEFAVGGVLIVPAATLPDTFRAEIAVSVTYD